MNLKIKPKILVVDDTPANITALRTLLKKVDAEVVYANSGNDALAMILEHDFALFLLDVQMPDMDGYELAEIIHSDNKTEGIPIIFITAVLRSETYRVKGYEHGAIDYIEKPINNYILLAKVNILLDLWKKNSELTLLSKDLTEKNIALQSEITKRKKIQAKLDHMAMYDSLTNLPNRVLLEKECHRMLSAANRYNQHVGFMFVDLDGFKKVNDNYGHKAGDATLIEMSSRMVTAVRDNDIVTRFGGDEFIILLPDCKTKKDIKKIASRLLQGIQQPLELHSTVLNLGISIGISVYPEDAKTCTKLVSLADKAMYAAKQAGKNQFKFAND